MKSRGSNTFAVEKTSSAIHDDNDRGKRSTLSKYREGASTFSYYSYSIYSGRVDSRVPEFPIETLASRFPSFFRLPPIFLHFVVLILYLLALENSLLDIVGDNIVFVY